MNGHLGAGMDGQARQKGVSGVEQAQVLDNDRIGAQTGKSEQIVQPRCEFLVVEQGIDRNINLAPMAVGIGNRLPHLGLVEIRGPLTGAESGAAQVNGIGAVVYCSQQSFPTAGRSQ